MESNEKTSSTSQQTPNQAIDLDIMCEEMVDSGIHDTVMGDRGAETNNKNENGNVEEVDKKQWIQLVKVLVLTAWDQVGLES